MTNRLTDLDPAEIAQELGLKPFQGKQLFQWIHRKRIFDFDRMTNLPKNLRETLKAQGAATQSSLVEMVESPVTGTKKALYRLEDGETVEAVLLRHGERTTLCLSTQAGCPIGCAFCATGLSGFRRNLSAGEIVEQALHLLSDEDLDDRTPNVVYMGMGEPFLNYDAVVRSIRLLMSEDGLGIGARKITVSTAGHVPGIRRFAEEDWQVRLSVSLHATRNALRSELVPLNRTYPIEELMRALRDYGDKTGRSCTVEWVLLVGVNDSIRDADELADLLRGLRASVNAIPYNGVPGSRFKAPAWPQCEAFCAALNERGIQATLRQERGQDIDAACGQLRRRHIESSPGKSL